MRLTAPVLRDVAWLQECLPGAGFPAVWPPCVDHPGSHPLEPAAHDGEAVWRCPRSHRVVAAVGALR